MNTNTSQFGFMPGKKTADVIFIVRRMQELYQKKDKKSLCVLLTWKKLSVECQEK